MADLYLEILCTHFKKSTTTITTKISPHFKKKPKRSKCHFCIDKISEQKNKKMDETHI